MTIRVLIISQLSLGSRWIEHHVDGWVALYIFCDCLSGVFNEQKSGDTVEFGWEEVSCPAGEYSISGNDQSCK